MITIWCFFKKLDLDHLFDGAAILSYYFILALFPGLLALLAIVSYIPSDVLTNENVYWIVKQAPESISNLILSVFKEVGGDQKLGLFSLSFIVAIWTVSNGVVATIRQLNTSYRVQEKRSFIQLRLIAILISFSVGLLILAPLTLNFLANYILNYLSFEGFDSSLITNILEFKYFIFFLLFFILFIIIYSFGPNQDRKFKEHLLGSLTCSTSFVLISHVFEYYLRNFADYSLLYGSVGTIIVLMLWFYILGLLIILGAELNYFYNNLKKNSSLA